MNILKSKLLSLALLIVLATIGIGVIRAQYSYYNLNEDARDLSQKLESIEQENAKLEKELNSLENEDYLKYQARTKLNYKQADEEVVFVYRENSDENTATSQASQDHESELPNYKKWLRWLISN